MSQQSLARQVPATWGHCAPAIGRVQLLGEGLWASPAVPNTQERSVKVEADGGLSTVCHLTALSKSISPTRKLEAL